MIKDAVPELTVGLTQQQDFYLKFMKHFWELVKTAAASKGEFIPFNPLHWIVIIHSNHITVTDSMWAEFGTILMFLIWLENCLTGELKLLANDFCMCEWGDA